MKRPVRWICSYDEPFFNLVGHIGHAKEGLDAECENIEAGRIMLIDADNQIILTDWADYADDSGLKISIEDARAIEDALNGTVNTINANTVTVP